MSLWQDFLTNDAKVIHKWVHYSPFMSVACLRYRNKS